MRCNYDGHLELYPYIYIYLSTDVKGEEMEDIEEKIGNGREKDELRIQYMSVQSTLYQSSYLGKSGYR